ncbi:pre-60S ribosomal particles component [Conoideocrella luteorostrata]|uniref:Pre-60S ribosomal particles component n=1 Tax=Conoideocrella luteorostrata TaxID=1105319 RepID=A0AAJ0CF56_9HYPO|nr:pre-60S ribosomal particles component [Conoideocrella luteorostrata]
MAGHKKRTIDAKQHRPSKKQKRAQQYNSDSDSGDEDQGFDAVNLLDSDNEDIHNATVDEAAQSGDKDVSSSSEDERSTTKRRKQKKAKHTEPNKAATDEDEDQEGEVTEEDDDDEESDVDEYDLDSDNAESKPKSKRNDPNAFATSISKILNTKLSSSKRSDPVLSRSAAAHEASKAAVESALESKAKRHIKEQKKKASEKGRVKDVLIATRDDHTGEAEASTAEILETEKKLRKVAQRGVVKLFNAVRAAQVKALEAEKDARKDGVIGMNNRESKVNELSKKGFLDLIASGGGGLKKGALEEA